MLLAGWGIALRLVLLICVPLAAVVALVTLGGGGWGATRFLAQRRGRRAARS